MIIVDVETTGINPNKHCILSLAAIDFNNQSNTFYGECRLKEGAEIDAGSLKVNGFTQEKIMNASNSYEELLRKFYDWTLKINNRTLTGYNVHFDIAFLRKGFEDFKIDWIYKYRMVDLHSVFYVYLLGNGIDIPLKNNISDISLDMVANFFSLGRTGEIHNALEDVKLTADIFNKILL